MYILFHVCAFVHAVLCFEHPPQSLKPSSILIHQERSTHASKLIAGIISLAKPSQIPIR